MFIRRVNWLPRRRHFLVKWGFQVRTLVTLCGAALALAICGSLLVFSVVEKAALDGMYRSHLPSGEVASMVRPTLVSVTILVIALSLVTTALICKMILRRSRAEIDRAAGMLAAIDRPSTVTWTAQELVDVGVILQVRRAVAERLAYFRKASDELKRGVKAARKNPARSLRSLENSLDQAIQILESGQNLFRH